MREREWRVETRERERENDKRKKDEMYMFPHERDRDKSVREAGVKPRVNPPFSSAFSAGRDRARARASERTSERKRERSPGRLLRSYLHFSHEICPGTRYIRLPYWLSLAPKLLLAVLNRSFVAAVVAASY